MLHRHESDSHALLAAAVAATTTVVGTTINAVDENKQDDLGDILMSPRNKRARCVDQQQQQPFHTFSMASPPTLATAAATQPPLLVLPLGLYVPTTTSTDSCFEAPKPPPPSQEKKRNQPHARPKIRRSASALGDHPRFTAFTQPVFASPSQLRPPEQQQPMQPPRACTFPPLRRSASCTSCRRSFDFENEEGGFLNTSPPRLVAADDGYSSASNPPLLARSNTLPLYRGEDDEEEEEEPELREPYYTYEPPHNEEEEGDDDEEADLFFSGLKLNPASPQPELAWKTPTRKQAYQARCDEIDPTSVADMIARCKQYTDLVVLDLDKTLLSIHTNGRFSGTGMEMAASIRPVFYLVIPALLNAGIPVGIATFSDQESIVKEMLECAFPCSVRMEENCFVRGNRRGEATSTPFDEQDTQNCDDFDDVEETSRSAFVGDERPGKRTHIRCILQRMGKPDLSPERILFVDDDAGNVEQAQIDGHRTVHFEELDEKCFFLRCSMALRNSK